MKTLAAIALSVAMLGAQAQADFAADSYEAFDQTPGRGWRALADDAKYQEAATLIDKFIAESPNAHGNIGILNFHAGQMHLCCRKLQGGRRAVFVEPANRLST